MEHPSVPSSRANAPPAPRQPPPGPQVVLVSATLPHEVLEMTHKFMTDPVRILVKRDELTLEVRVPRGGACTHSLGTNCGCAGRQAGTCTWSAS